MDECPTVSRSSTSPVGFLQKTRLWTANLCMPRTGSRSSSLVAIGYLLAEKKRFWILLNFACCIFVRKKSVLKILRGSDVSTEKRKTFSVLSLSASWSSMFGPLFSGTDSGSWWETIDRISLPCTCTEGRREERLITMDGTGLCSSIVACHLWYNTWFVLVWTAEFKWMYIVLRLRSRRTSQVSSDGRFVDLEIEQRKNNHGFMSSSF